MRVRVYTADVGGCGHYRLIFPARVLYKAGHDVQVITHEDEGADNFVTVKENVRHEIAVDGQIKPVLLPVVRGVQKPDADVVVLQRPLRRELVECIPFLQQHGVAVVVELDDDFEAIPARNIAWRQTHPAMSPERNHRWLRLACQMADLVTCSTPALGRKYGGYVLPNCVPERYLSIEADRDADGPPTIGWSGSVATHPDDLQQTGPAVRKLLEQDRARFAVVGDGKFVAYAMGLNQARGVPASGFVSIDKYPEYMAQFDVGIVPLELNAFNQAKSWLKGLEFASLGVPFVASPTFEYCMLESIGAGILARKQKDWFPKLGRLCDMAPEARLETAAKARQAVADLTYENRADRWWTAWEIAHVKRKAASHG